MTARLEQPACSVQLEWHLRDQHEIHIAASQRGIARDEAGVPAHQFHETHAVHRAERLAVRAFQRLHRHAKRRLESERLVEIHDVVVDRLRDAHDRLFQTAPLDLRRQRIGPAERAVAADDEKNVATHFLEKFHHFADILRPARGAEDGSAEVVNLRDVLRFERHRRVAILRHQPLVAIAETVRRGDAVAQVKLGDDAANDVVQARAKSAACHNPGGGFCGIEKDVLARAGHLEAELRLRQFSRRHPVIEEHALVVCFETHIHSAAVAQRRDDLAGAERRNGGIHIARG
jgi:hypothetical protein